MTRFRLLVAAIFFIGSISILFYFKLFLTSNEYFLSSAVQDLKLQLMEDEIFFMRENHLHKMCSKNPSWEENSEENGYQKLAANSSLLSNIIVNDKFKVLYCYVPKVACTNWKRVMLLLNGTKYSKLEQIPADSVHRKSVFAKLSDMKPTEILHRLKTYKKFIFVRHPIERVLSAFRNKFEMNYTSSAYFKKRFGVAILKKYRYDVPLKDLSQTGDGVKFFEFVDYLIDVNTRNPRFLNEHWSPFTQLCLPCDVRYNLIGKYETLERDAQHILNEVDAPNEIRFPAVTPSKTSDLVDSYIATLNPERLKRLLWVYEKDFRIFDYHFRQLI